MKDDATFRDEVRLAAVNSINWARVLPQVVYYATAASSLGAPDHIAHSPWVVMKFGGTSVSTADKWLTIAGLIRNRLADGLRPVIVHSALAGVVEALVQGRAPQRSRVRVPRP